MKRIDFYLDFVSPYAWLAFEQLPRALEGLGYAVRYRPVLLTALLKHHGQLALLDHAPRRDWARRHALWLAHSLDIELDLPAAYPFNPLPLLRLAWASARQGAPNRFVCEMIFRHVWQGGAAADDPARLQALREQLAPARVPDSDEVKDDLRAATDAALAVGVFGVPSFVVDGRLFWGLDALPMLRAQLEDDARLDAARHQAAQSPSLGENP